MKLTPVPKIIGCLLVIVAAAIVAGIVGFPWGILTWLVSGYAGYQIGNATIEIAEAKRRKRFEALEADLDRIWRDR
ncbi:hypothetical protein [Mycobacteroides abscessus]|uniref:hypothetical protein n=1 Tax=Mycobacteroides abscessus TaxID=36809 RepID=UPI00092C2432|nr:hypothetical protein [Mycobacteroides abscessus]SKS27798.1 Uncharacterised protein [Mycobacteroides abscessus subsp. abscessus]SHU54873.1 Uncharacterised protein [Mycobacteroides abscessus subsp. bolletii]SHW63463.1 Uncharacterised protein [Mycobacteroides abscessus subsp. bolletii]SHW91522.1 Uncharacterised protein [Mycobacteroides abscessus subsp. bolletii]SHX33631.1 Uncharacterised protein [Mycobacteroides abscessus subsp. bolletii]